MRARFLKNSFVVNYSAKLFSTLNKLTAYGIFKCIFPNIAERDGVIDMWALLHLVGSVIAAIINPIVLILYGAWRVFEIFVYQVNVLIFDQYRAIKSKKDYSLVDPYRMIILLLLNYAEVILWFSAFYYSSNQLVPIPTETFDPLGFSFNMMTSFGQADSYCSNCSKELAFIQALLGIFMSIFVLARFISLLPDPDKPEQNSSIGTEKLDEGC